MLAPYGPSQPRPLEHLEILVIQGAPGMGRLLKQWGMGGVTGPIRTPALQPRRLWTVSPTGGGRHRSGQRPATCSGPRERHTGQWHCGCLSGWGNSGVQVLTEGDGVKGVTLPGRGSGDTPRILTDADEPSRGSRFSPRGPPPHLNVGTGGEQTLLQRKRAGS